MTQTAIEGAYQRTARIFAAAAALGYIGLAKLFGLLDTPNSVVDWASLVWTLVGTTLGGFFAFQFIFEKWLWRWSPLRGRLVQFPDLSGAWMATYHSLSFDIAHSSAATINHDFDHIVYKTERVNTEGEYISEEVSESCTITRNGNTGRVELFIVYRNSPGHPPSRDPHSMQHRGCAYLELLNEGSDRSKWILKGEYWTNKPWPAGNAPRSGGTRGTIELKSARR